MKREALFLTDKSLDNTLEEGFIISSTGINGGHKIHQWLNLTSESRVRFTTLYLT